MSDRPNIVLILNDDMGYSDLGCYGGEVATPTLDRLASNGIRFTQFYNTARCCPSRASLLTGLHPHQAGVGHMMGDDGIDGYRGDLNDRCATIAEALGEHGYRNYMSGKWHISRHISPDGPKHSWPLQRGFDRYFGIITGAANYWSPRTLTRGNTQLDLNDLPDDFFLTDAISDEAAGYVRDHAANGRGDPFFMYVAYTAPHWPLHAHEEDIARYEGRFADGWDILRDDRLARMRRMGLLKEEWALTPRDASQLPWTEAEHRAWNQRRMEAYAAQIDRMDQGIGRIVEALEASGQLENTLIMFLADNGGCAEELGGRARTRDRDSHIATARTRQDGKLVYHGNDPSIMPGPETTYQSYGVPWANVSNTPFRLYKHWTHEGGIATPFIAHWPSGFESRGELRHQPGQLTDVMATCLEASGASYPETLGGREILPLEGRSLLPIFHNNDNGKEAFYWEHEGNRAVRQGNWKLVNRHPGGWELYDIEADRTEMRDLSSDRPEVARELGMLWDAWARRCNVYPWADLQELRRSRR